MCGIVLTSQRSRHEQHENLDRHLVYHEGTSSLRCSPGEVAVGDRAHGSRPPVVRVTYNLEPVHLESRMPCKYLHARGYARDHWWIPGVPEPAHGSCGSCPIKFLFTSYVVQAQSVPSLAADEIPIVFCAESG